VTRKQSISILNLANDTEFKLVIIPQAHELDFFEHCFVTGEIPEVKLHYFEQVHKEEGKLNYRSYNIFDLHADFWQCLMVFQ
jgi:alkyl hydroperoxide reductase subunit AhpF